MLLSAHHPVFSNCFSEGAFHPFFNLCQLFQCFAYRKTEMPVKNRFVQGVWKDVPVVPYGRNDYLQQQTEKVVVATPRQDGFTYLFFHPVQELLKRVYSVFHAFGSTGPHFG